MEKELNIAEILKDKPKGTKLHDWLRNIDVRLNKVQITDVVDYIECTSIDKEGSILLDYSKLGTEINWLNGLQILKPSKEMRDWLRFTWKKGDVLQHSEYPLTVIFESFEDDTYTSFKCKYCFNFESDSKWLVSNSQCSTKHFYKVSEEEAKEFIRKVELNYNGKLNRETLEIEKAQIEFKDGDILLYKSTKPTYVSSIFILDTNRKYEMRSYVRFSIEKGYIDYDVPVYNLNTDRFRYATEEEKQQLFSALAKEGKAWDAEKKMIVDLKPKAEFKPFDKVVAFEELTKEWVCDMFSHYSKNNEGKEIITCIGGCAYFKVLHFNEETAKLLGTTKNMES